MKAAPLGLAKEGVGRLIHVTNLSTQQVLCGRDAAQLMFEHVKQ